MNNELPLVSIIVPVYKVEKYLNQCVESIINQTYKKLEIILIDDGSPDDSGAICDGYANDPRVKVIHSTNHGVSHTRNTGLEQATGDYIAFCDSDDYYALDYVEKNISTALEQDSDITISGYYVEQCGKFVSSVHLEGGSLSVEDVVRHFTIDNEFGGYCWNKLYKRKILQDVKFPDDMAILEDTYFLCSAMRRAKRIYYLAEPLYYYCDNQYSATRNVDTLYSDHDTIKYIDSYRKILTDHKLSQRSIDIIRGVMFEMAVIFRSYEYQGRHHGSPQLKKRLDTDAKELYKGYYHCDEFSLKRKAKWILKMVWPKLHIHK
ncbi:glycosyltransferase [Lactobacillus delbrueckii subsp. sunkii]|uniref:Glycosyltransferase n=1 Tax=Lactobacillus delbrueckii subsp. allosunkii TaxID=1050107 RepID=A0ABD4SBI2_9LACO|nr:glycosyltransferase [Lactobacillus delbrueckii]MCD5518236.1 glycosyltransferase [Lactobacillus delbrueckii subsp. sunkii]MCT3477186.1 glycosyltransferase [Lactobacillus delbrueckii subsp. lactis]